MAAAVYFLVTASVGLRALLLLLSSEFRCNHWQCVVVVVGGVPSPGWFFRLRRLATVVGVGVSLSSAESLCRFFCQVLVVVVGVLSLLLASRRRLCLVVVGGGFPILGCFHRILHLVVNVSVGVSSSSFFLASRCRYWRLVCVGGVSFCSRCRIIVVVVGISSSFSASCHRRCLVVVGSGVPYCDCFRRILRLVVFFVVGVLLLSSLSAASHCCRRRRRRNVLWKVSSILGLPHMQPPWIRNTKHRMVLLWYWVCVGWILSGRHPNERKTPHNKGQPAFRRDVNARHPISW